VDDGSSDQTVTILEQIGAHCCFPIRVVRLSRNFGHQNAIIAGLRVACSWAEKLGASLIGVMDADLQDQPEHLPVLMDETREHDIAYAVRESRKDSLAMRILAPTFYRILSSFSVFDIPRDSGAFCVMRLFFAKILLSASDCNCYFPGLRAWAGFRQKAVLLPRGPRFKSLSKVGWNGLFALAFRALLLYSDLPIKLVLYGGAAVITASVFSSLILIVLRIFNLITIPGATSIIVLIFFSLGIEMLFLGMIAHMINQSRLNSSQQPPWLIMEIRTINAENDL
jgi:dolichol-phosphate mannosyltransferase